MKKLLLITLLGLFSMNFFGQIHLISKGKAFYAYDEQTSKYEKYAPDEADNTMFTVSESNQIITQKTEKGVFNYYVNSSEKDTKNNVLVYNVMGEDGNKSVFIFDTTNKQIRIVFKYTEKDKNGKTSTYTLMTIYFLKNILVSNN